MSNIKRTIASNSLTFALGFIAGTAAANTERDSTGFAGDEVGDVDTSSDSTTSVFDTTETGAPDGVPDYCTTYPQYCNDPEPCPTTIDPTGRKVSQCFPAEWACCAPSLGCWAVNFPSECGNAGLYWFDCNAGEQTVDPVTGEGVLVCHD